MAFSENSKYNEESHIYIINRDASFFSFRANSDFLKWSKGILYQKYACLSLLSSWMTRFRVLESILEDIFKLKL